VDRLDQIARVGSLKQVVRDRIAPDRDLGHADRPGD